MGENMTDETSAKVISLSQQIGKIAAEDEGFEPTIP